MPSLDRKELAALPLLLVPYALMVQAWWFVCDDAFITWRYSRNVANGFGPRYNLGDELPVEGYSDFLWMLIGAAFEAVGVAPRLAVPWVSAVCGVAVVAWVWKFLRDRTSPLSALLGAATMALTPPFAVWSTSGLETMAQVLCLWGTFVFLVHGDDDSPRHATIAGVFGLALALVRTEGIAWCVVLGALAAALRWWQGRPIGPALSRYAATLLVPFAIYYAWRTAYYQSLVGNTAKAKVHLGPDTLARGLMYVALYVATLLAPLLALPAAASALRGPRRVEAATAAFMAVAVTGYAVVVSGDYMTWFRILVPTLPFVAVVAGLALHRLEQRSGKAAAGLVGAFAVTLGLLPGFDVHLVPESARESLSIREKLGFFRSENQQWTAMNEHVSTWTEKGLALKLYAKPGDTYVAAAIGATGYYSDLYIYDRNGLVNREVAEQPWNGELRSPGHDKVVDRSFFFDKNPDILDAKVLTTARLSSQLRAALKEMEATEVQDRYYPDVFPLPAEGRKAADKVLLALRRADDPTEAQARWAEFKTHLAGLKGAAEELPPVTTEGSDEP